MNERKYKHAGIVNISHDRLCEMLGYPGGIITSAEVGHSSFYVEVTIVHPDMPKTYEGEVLMRVEARG